MCGIAGVFATQTCQPGDQHRLKQPLDALIQSQQHRGPDAQGHYISPAGHAGLGHNRLSIIDLSAAGRQPMANQDGTIWLAFNGEIYNYLELRAELHDYPYRSQSDTEVILAAYERWGEDCVEHFLGMFAFLLWDERQQTLFAARDRFGVKPLYYHQQANGDLLLASEIKALHRAGVPAVPDEASWASYFTQGLKDQSDRTFWQNIRALPPGGKLKWQAGQLRLTHWYDLAERVGPDFDLRPIEQVQEEYGALLLESVHLRFRSDVPVGINLSGGLDSSTLLGLVHAVQGLESDVQAFTFVCDDPQYDELPWVRQMLAHTKHPLVICHLRPAEVPALAASVQTAQDEPFGGLPTLAYARLFEEARAHGNLVLLDGQGMDEQWAGYDYFLSALNGQTGGIVQGMQASPVRPDCLTPEFRALAAPFAAPQPFSDPLRNMQYRDARFTKLPRALRFNDRISMRASTELREPFLDHRLFELALRQPLERKLKRGVRKWLLRQIVQRLLPTEVVEAPKRPVQTPQREWLRGPLETWATDCIEAALQQDGGCWLEPQRVRASWREYRAGSLDNSFYVWQWINLHLMQSEFGRQALPQAVSVQLQ